MALTIQPSRGIILSFLFITFSYLFFHVFNVQDDFNGTGFAFFFTDVKAKIFFSDVIYEGRI